MFVLVVLSLNKHANLLGSTQIIILNVVDTEEIYLISPIHNQRPGRSSLNIKGQLQPCCNIFHIPIIQQIYFEDIIQFIRAE